MLELVERAAAELEIPFTVGGGIAGLEDARGAAPRRRGQGRAEHAPPSTSPALLTALADEFGAQAVVCAIDARAGEVVTHGGRNAARARRDRRGRRRRPNAAPARSC